MLPPKNRLKKNNEFEKVISRGRSVSSHPVFLKLLQNNSGISRFGIAVGVKFSKKAVERNAVKRKIRAFLKENLDYFKSGFDVIIIPRRARYEKDSVDWRKELNKAFQRANLIK